MEQTDCKVAPLAILPAAVGVGLLLEVLKYINLLTWPYFPPKFASEYGPFTYANVDFGGRALGSAARRY